MIWDALYIKSKCEYFKGEILPSDMRSFGSGLLGILDNISLFIALKTVPIMIGRWSSFPYYYTFRFDNTLSLFVN